MSTYNPKFNTTVFAVSQLAHQQTMSQFTSSHSPSTSTLTRFIFAHYVNDTLQPGFFFPLQSRPRQITHFDDVAPFSHLISTVTRYLLPPAPVYLLFPVPPIITRPRRHPGCVDKTTNRTSRSWLPGALPGILDMSPVARYSSRPGVIIT